MAYTFLLSTIFVIAIVIKLFLQKKSIDTKKMGKFITLIGAIIASIGIAILIVLELGSLIAKISINQVLFKAMFPLINIGIYILCVGVMYTIMPQKSS